MEDVVIIGSGAGGGPLALSFARAGLRTLVLEKGPEIAREDYPHDEVSATWRSPLLPAQSEDPHLIVRDGYAAPRRANTGWVACCVGGGTVHMGSYFSRFHPDDFRLRSRFGEHENLVDWPYSYDDLEPYYTRAEWEIGVSGDADANPFEGWRSRPYPMPPLASNPLATFLDRACRQHGLHPFPTPRGINSVPYQGRPSCSYCSFCAGYGCRTGAKGTSQEALLARARETGHCEVRPLSMVREITVGPDGKAKGCIYIDSDGREHEIRARIVCVCCSAVESARLLLLSKSPLFPEGLANHTGLVGKNLQFQSTSSGQARFRRGRHPRDMFSHPNPFVGRALMDYYFLPEGVSDLPKGGMIVFRHAGLGPILRSILLAQQGGTTSWGMPLKRTLRDFFQDVDPIDIELYHDFIPNNGTFVELDPEARDRWGLPAARIHIHGPDHHARVGGWVIDRGLDVLSTLGADEVSRLFIGEVAGFLVQGTCRAGRDPQTSVLNEYCQTHEVPNLFVVDGSFMPTAGGAPPTLTILANSFRTADFILENARQGEFQT